MSERAVAKSRSQTQNASRLVLSIGLLTGSLLSGMSWAQSESSNAQQWFDRIERGDIQLRQEARTPQVQRIMAQNRAEQQEQQRVTREVARESAREARQQASEARRAAHEARREAQEAQRVQIEAARERPGCGVRLTLGTPSPNVFAFGKRV